MVTRYAYVLFYRRRNSPVERPSRLLRPHGAESSAATGSAASQVSSEASLVTLAQWKKDLAEVLCNCSLKLQRIVCNVAVSGLKTCFEVCASAGYNLRIRG